VIEQPDPNPVADMLSVVTTLPTDVVPCVECGAPSIPTGTCAVCTQCGATTGCS
jgi:hypothetical protein